MVCADPDQLSQAQPQASSPALNRTRFPKYLMKTMTGKPLAHHRRSLPSRHPFASAPHDTGDQPIPGDNRETEDDSSGNFGANRHG
jgi:hypothetical protein